MLKLFDTVSTVLRSAWEQIIVHCATIAEGSIMTILKIKW